MSMKIIYKDDYNKNADIEVGITVKDPDITLSQLFAVFVEMSRIAGYHSASWETIINELYGYCVLHVDAAEDYDIYSWANDINAHIYDVF